MVRNAQAWPRVARKGALADAAHSAPIDSWKSQATGGSTFALDRPASRLTCRNVSVSLPPESHDEDRARWSVDEIRDRGHQRGLHSGELQAGNRDSLHRPSPRSLPASVIPLRRLRRGVPYEVGGNGQVNPRIQQSTYIGTPQVVRSKRFKGRLPRPLSARPLNGLGSQPTTGDPASFTSGCPKAPEEGAVGRYQKRKLGVT